MAIRNGREFLLAIKESTHTVFDDDAVEFLDDLVAGICATLDKQGARGPDRDRMLYFDGMLRGVQLRLVRDQQRQRKALGDVHMLTGDGKVPKV